MNKEQIKYEIEDILILEYGSTDDVIVSKVIKSIEKNYESESLRLLRVETEKLNQTRELLTKLIGLYTNLLKRSVFGFTFISEVTMTEVIKILDRLEKITKLR